MAFAIEIISPKRVLLQAEVDELVLPSVDGEAGVLAQHADYLAQLRAGELVVIREGQRQSFAIQSGFAKVNPQGAIVLVEET